MKRESDGERERERKRGGKQIKNRKWKKHTLRM